MTTLQQLQEEEVHKWKVQLIHAMDGLKTTPAEEVEEVIQNIITTAYIQGLERAKEIAGVLPSNWKEEKWRYNNEILGESLERERILTSLTTEITNIKEGK